MTTLTTALDRVVGLDQRLFRMIYHLNVSLGSARALKIIAHSADGIWYPLLALLAIFTMPELAMTPIFALLVGFALERPAYKLLKNHFRRNRPCTTLHEVDNRIPYPDVYSFPSGHTSGSTLVTAVICMCYPVMAIVMVPWTLAVGFSRIRHGVHYPLDVLMGMIIGTLTALIGLMVVN